MTREAALGGAADAVSNLKSRKVKPLRGTAKAPAGETRRISVEELKTGGTIDFSALLPESASAPPPLRRLHPGGSQPRASNRGAANSELSEAERLAKLAGIKKAATDYEAMFVDLLVKQMRPSPLTQTPGRESFMSIAEQPFRDFLSRAGGLGLAGSLTGQIARQEGLEETLRKHPEVMGPGWRAAIPRNLQRSNPRGLALAGPPDPAETAFPRQEADARETFGPTEAE